MNCVNKKIADQNEVLEKIKLRQKGLADHLVICDEGNSIWTRTTYNLSKGCAACKNGSLMAVYTGNKCNIECKYCPQGSNEEKNIRPESERSTRDMWIDDVKKTITEQADMLTAISFTGGEPFLYLPKIVEIASYIRDNHPQIYMFMYTNGTLATEESLKMLSQCGISEIRFHWGATDFTEEILNKMKIAKKYFKYVNVETPAFIETYNNLIIKRKIYQLIDAGINQINLGEFIINCKMNWEFIGDNTIYNYKSDDFKVFSPIYSRNVVYDIMEYVITNHLDIIINDCSNDAKSWQRHCFRKTGIEYCC